MKLVLHCPACERELFGLGDEEKHIVVTAAQQEALTTIVDVNEDGTYGSECRQGHAVRAVLVNPPFVLLFEAAALALSDGYRREAVSSFAAALEATYAFYIQLTGRILGLGDDELGRLAKDTKLSERRRGAVTMAYALNEKAPFPLRDNDKRDGVFPDGVANFRNEVIHEGAWPTDDEALEYGGYVYDAVYMLLDGLRRTTPELVANEMGVRSSRVAAARAKLESGPQDASTTIVLTIGTTIIDRKPAAQRTAFREEFARWAARRNHESSAFRRTLFVAPP